MRMEVPDSKLIGRLRLTLHGFDLWVPEWIRIVFNDQTYADCPDGNIMAGGEEHDLDCENVNS